MNWVVLGFFVILLTARFFSETLRVIPKAFDLVDLVFIPLLAVGAVFAGSSLKGVDKPLHRKLMRWTVTLAVLSVVSSIANVERSHWAPTLQYIFGIAAGPALYLSLNALIRNKAKMAEQTARFLYFMFIVEGVVVLFVSLPLFFSTGNPDYVSGTFGQNAYQFSVLLIIIGGYFLGKMRFGQTRFVISLGIQIGVVVTFLLLQYRTATPAFFAAYLVLIGLLYGKRVVRLTFYVGLMGAVGFYAFGYVASSNIDLKFDDIITFFQNPEMATDFGKVIAYGNTFQMYSDQPSTVLFGAGPGTMVSRAAYTFIMEPMVSTQKGVGALITSTFPNQSFRTDVFTEYMEPLFDLESVFGSVQANNPASSILAAMAEIGIPGLVLLVLIYGTMLKRVFQYARFAIAHVDPQLVPLSSALVTGSVYLCFLSPLDNYLEIARVTLPVWLLFWTVSSMVHLRKQLRLMERIEREEALAEMLHQQNPVHAPTR
ncbi:MAG: hypothetical protein H7X80_06475 [bacterium]|nr:hypothetical protein [Candidatus Kapabacteria bacterium]